MKPCLSSLIVVVASLAIQAACASATARPWADASLLDSSPAVQDTLFVSQSRGILHHFELADSAELVDVLRIVQEHDLNIWHLTPSSIDIYFPPDSKLNLELTPLLNDILHSTQPISVPPAPSLYSTTNTLIDQWNLSSLTNTTYHSVYHPLYEIDAFMVQLTELYPTNVKLADLGHSGEGREMRAVQMTKGDKKTRPAFVIMGAQHAREWIATASALYLAHALVANTSETHSLRHLLDEYEFHIIPAPNPDGYTYTWESDRFWYKNRMITTGGAKCIGVDTNRNWGYKWKPKPFPEDYDDINVKKPKQPVDPCSHWYPGSRAFEAPETNNIANYISFISAPPSKQPRAFIDLRAYGQMVSSPYSWSCSKKMPKDAEDQIEAGTGMVRVAYAGGGDGSAPGARYTSGRLCEMLYEAPGNVIDWMYARAGIKYSYALHLRDTGTYGFSLPAQWIRPVGEETARMMEYLAGFMLKHK